MSSPPLVLPIRNEPLFLESVEEVGLKGEAFRPTGGSRIWRDSAGRMRIENALSVGVERPILVQLIDSGIGNITFLDTLSKTAHRIKTAPVEVPDVAHQNFGLLYGMASSDGGGSVRQDPLGMREIAGVSAEGVSMRLIKPGVADASPAMERWVSRDLGLILLTKIQEEGRTVITRAIVVKKGDPPAALFEVPDGFTILDASDVDSADTR